ncbi:hypothetical protein CHH59_07630 [Shouchella clausii]|uniref:DUF445 domain-containing protein n=1 Tax=Shouchella clausii TaxID=79880 RepID=A0A268RVN2_SHOCL|nr:DUF445 family protein [Shouchella clausii]PAD40715.1 hypothetical protein CHH54_21165 [Bacillus sp. 7520-S]PAE91967.1 hypothetical protein CHH71_21100 [Shouchella clausii]PAF14621.1 hypothetical protein CHH59_07630 [Shouchella clausii]PAF23806.1 hypothetical protein CHH61_21925 [Shouchella clausii]
MTVHWIWLVLLLAVVGAIVGAATNALAIRMLFRPHRAYSIGKWQLPFTPGLLPRRQKELAVQLGNIVANHLLTAEGLGKKFGSTAFAAELTNWLKKQLASWLRSERTVESILKPLFQADIGRERLVVQSKSWLKDRLKRYLQKNKEVPIKSVVPQELQDRLTNWLPEASALLLKRATAYIDSEEGEQRIGAMVRQFLSTKGKVGSMVSMFFSADKLTEYVLPEIKKFLQDEQTKETVQSLLQSEWHRMLNRPLASFQAENYVDQLVDKAAEELEGKIPVLNWYNAPLRTWTTPYAEPLVERGVSVIVGMVTTYMEQHIADILSKLRLEEVIEAQVASFSMAHLEKLIMNITRRELHMITLLGGLIGGIVGLVQAVIVHFFY